MTWRTIRDMWLIRLFGRNHPIGVAAFMRLYGNDPHVDSGEF